MEVKQWAGLVTNASPYILPPGANAIQENLHCSVPGQLSVRDGMRLAEFDGDPGIESISFYPYFFNGTTRIVAIAADGTVTVLEAPSLADAPEAPDEPVLSPGSGEVESSYTGRFYDHGQEEPA